MSRVKLGDVADTCLGKMLDAEKNKGVPHPYLANINVRWGSFDLDNLQEMPFEDDEAERYGLRPGDLVMCEGGEPGRCTLWKDASTDMRFQKALHRIRAHEGILDIRYLYYWFLYAGKRGMLDRYFTQTTIKHLVGEDLRTVELDLPELERQKAMADVLSTIDAKIETNAKAIAELDSLARTVYDYWFTQFDFPDENGNPYRTSGGKMVWNEALRHEIPEGWKVVSLEDCMELEKGYSYSSDELVDDGMPMINLASVTRQRSYNPSGLKYLNLDGACERMAEPGDMLIACTDLTRLAEIVGSPIFVPTFYESYVYSMDLAKVSLKEGELLPGYLYALLRTPTYRNYIKGFVSGTNVQHLDVNGIYWRKVALPPVELQNRFNGLVLGCRDETSRLMVESARLTALRDYLLPMLMNGQVTIESEAR